MKILIKTTDEKYYSKLSRYEPYLCGILSHLKKVYRLRLPKTLIFRPMRKVQGRHMFRMNLGVAGYLGLEKQYYIAIAMEYTGRGKRYVLDLIAHEAAHIAEALKTDRWTHGELFEEMYREGKRYLKSI